MAAVNGDKDMRAWLREQGETVSSRGRVRGELSDRYYAQFPDRRPAGSVALLPGPDDDLDSWDDMGMAIPDPFSEPQREPEPSGGPQRYEAIPEDAGAADVSPDGPPGHASKEWRKQQDKRGGGQAPRRGKVTASIRGDIGAKISFALEIPGQLWKARDPICGGTFVEQRPEIAEALTDIVCDSPDLIAFFAGPGGAFMKYLKLAAACWPVATVAMAHHVYHSIEEQPVDAQQPDYANYAA
jgi:hypothetical protein